MAILVILSAMVVHKSKKLDVEANSRNAICALGMFT